MRFVAWFVVVAACGDDPSLRVSVNHPTDARIHDAIRRTTVTVYESATLSCTDVEFGDVTDDELSALAVAEVETTETISSGSFSGVSRLDHKVIVARGLGIEGELIAAGCAEVDDVEAGVAVIETIPSALATITEAGDLMGGILITTTDPFSRALQGRKVSWRTFGPSGTSASAQHYENLEDGVWQPKSPSCTRDGETTIHPAPPNFPGGYAVRLRVSWSAARIPLFTRFTRLAALSQAFSPDPAGAIVRRCAVRRDASATASGLVCLASRNQALDFSLAGGALTAQPAPTSAAVAVVSIPGINGRLDTYAIDDLGNWSGLFGAAPVNATTPNPWCPGTCDPDEKPTPLDIQVVPSCGGVPGVLLARLQRGIATKTTQILVMPWRGGPAGTTMTDAPIANAGCLTELQEDGGSVIRQAIVFGEDESDRTPSLVSFPCDGPASKRCNLPITDGAAFPPGDEPRMLISTFDATGTVLTSVVARPTEGGTMREGLIERTRQPAASPPQEIVFGRFDADNDLDLFWYFAPPFGRNSTSIQGAYAREVDGVPLTALDRFEGIITEAHAADLDNDQLDEIIIVANRAAAPGLHVVPMGTPLADNTPVDPPCP
ncbi:MAG: hypothetical protein WKG01_31340 [Kofleriaceae bacterium]